MRGEARERQEREGKTGEGREEGKKGKVRDGRGEGVRGEKEGKT